MRLDFAKINKLVYNYRIWLVKQSLENSEFLENEEKKAKWSGIKQDFHE